MAPSSLVKTWFGEEFNYLHPMLRDLHTYGGILKGKVLISLGKGLRKYIGSAIAKKMGITLKSAEQDFEVIISHQNEVLHWTRRFGKENFMKSEFKPIGNKSQGYWLETTGSLTLALTVDIIEGGWYWRCIKIWIKGIRVPRFLFPKTTAYKRIENEKYRFYVGFNVLFLGTVLSYEGLLDAISSPINS